MSTPTKVSEAIVAGELRCYLDEDKVPELSEPIECMRGLLRANYGVSVYGEASPTGVIALEDGELYVTPHDGESYFAVAPPPHLADAVARVRITVSVGLICLNVTPGWYGDAYAPATASVKSLGPQGTVFTVTGEGCQGLWTAWGLLDEIINGPAAM